MDEVTTMDNLPVTSLTQMATLLDEFETTADVSEEELNGSSEEIAEAMLKELDETELSNTAKSSLQQTLRTVYTVSNLKLHLASTMKSTEYLLKLMVLTLRT